MPTYSSEIRMFSLTVYLGCEVIQSCPTLCNPMDCSPPGSSLHGILQARVLEWIAISFSRGSSWPRDQTQVSCIAGRRFTLWATRESQEAFPFPFSISSFGFLWSCCIFSLRTHQPDCPLSLPWFLPSDCSPASGLVSFPNEGLTLVLLPLPKALNFLYQATSYAGKTTVGLYCFLTVSASSNYLIVPLVNDLHTCFV